MVRNLNLLRIIIEFLALFPSLTILRSSKPANCKHVLAIWIWPLENLQTAEILHRSTKKATSLRPNIPILVDFDVLNTNAGSKKAHHVRIFHFKFCYPNSKNQKHKNSLSSDPISRKFSHHRPFLVLKFVFSMSKSSTICVSSAANLLFVLFFFCLFLLKTLKTRIKTTFWELLSLISTNPDVMGFFVPHNSRSERRNLQKLVYWVSRTWLFF